MANIGDDITKKLINSSGLKPGMKVLDLGCGNGDVSVLLAECVGKDGEVVGVDQNASAIKSAENNVKQKGLFNVQFLVKDFSEELHIGADDFDAVLIRRVLMYLPNAEATLKAAADHLKPGGILLVQENDMSLIPIGLEDLRLHKKIITIIKKTLRAEGVNPRMGFELYSVLVNAGLKVEKIWTETTISTTNLPTPWAFLAENMKERMVKQNVIQTTDELKLKSLAARLAEERKNSDQTFITDLVFCAVARKA